MFQALLKKRAINRAYNRTVDDCLTVLFCGFPHGLLPALRHRVNISGLVRRGQAQGNNARACSVQVAVLLTRKIIGPLNQQERQELAQAFLQKEGSNPTYKGFKCMFQVAEQLNVSPALVAYLTTEVAGQLRGMSQEAIFSSWVEAQIGGVMGQLRERSRGETERSASELNSSEGAGRARGTNLTAEQPNVGWWAAIMRTSATRMSATGRKQPSIWRRLLSA